MSVVSNPTAGTTVGTEVSQELAPGILVALSAFLLPTANAQFFVFVDIGIKTDVQDNSGRRVSLANGYLRQQQGITWTGLYPIASGDRMYMLIRGITNTPIQLMERRLTPDTLLIPGVRLDSILRAT